ncbi:ABC transporter ATP-binding protein [Paenibacillus agricola]|uniref:ATP-binding cassette domain-containing protein n=1 Tax=Paenibacillus agricola TaxID=2716264 RepID=A0ABX0J628_9BACL|nr:oligopeptide/dipeptide ABC transporter ATP-binding protein [Paenibacillus agricola]NHN31083.1 ATP-binding cassette domain-containing protein [Paenibacillus agricola]
MVDSTTEDAVASPLLVVENLKKYYNQPFSLFRKHNPIKAVDGISFDLHAGKALGLVGESGCGKSTAGRAVLKLDSITSGKVFFKGNEITHLQGDALRELRKDMQIVFQDPYSSLNGRMRVKDILAEPFKIHGLHPGREYQEVKRLLEMVGLLESSFDKMPHEFSGGQRQRIVIARAIALRPQFIVCDEPVSALDVSVQSQIVNLFSQLQKELDLSYLFISHGLSVVRHICDRVGVMYLGKLVELGDKKSIFSNPLHPYTQALINAIPTPNPRIQRTREKITLEGDLPSPMNPPSGCHFHTRCPYAQERCKVEEPQWREIEPAHWVSCHFAPLT